MKRNTLALGASMLALALTAGPASAQAQTTQVVDDSAVTAQVGSVQVNAPVRVASDGDDTAPAPAGGGTQTTTDSAGTAQVGSVQVNAPVRVASDGDNGLSTTGASAGPQTADDSIGTAQAGPVDVDAPVRVASDGDNRRGQGSANEHAGGQQSTDDSIGSVQVGSVDADAPVRVASDGGATAEGAGSDGGGSDGGGSLVDTGGQADEAVPAIGLVADRRSTPTGRGTAGVRTLNAGGLPFTGLELLAAFVLGLVLLTNGIGLKRAFRLAH